MVLFSFSVCEKNEYDFGWIVNLDNKRLYIVYEIMGNLNLAHSLLVMMVYVMYEQEEFNNYFQGSHIKVKFSKV